MSVPSTCSHTALRQNARFSEKKGDVNKKFRRGQGYMQIVHTLVYLLLLVLYTRNFDCRGKTLAKILLSLKSAKYDRRQNVAFYSRPISFEKTMM